MDPVSIENYYEHHYRYFWSLIAPYFETDGIVAKVFMMITFTKIE